MQPGQMAGIYPPTQFQQSTFNQQPPIPPSQNGQYLGSYQPNQKLGFNQQLPQQHGQLPGQYQPNQMDKLGANRQPPTQMSFQQNSPQIPLQQPPQQPLQQLPTHNSVPQLPVQQTTQLPVQQTTQLPVQQTTQLQSQQPNVPQIPQVPLHPPHAPQPGQWTNTYPSNQLPQSGFNQQSAALPPPPEHFASSYLPNQMQKLNLNQQQPPPPPPPTQFSQQSHPPQHAQMPRTYASPSHMQQPSYNQQANYNQQTSYNQQPQQRLDPDHMPSVVQVIEEDKLKYEKHDDVLFTTSIPASVPPLVTTIYNYNNLLINDGGCARPNFLRSTLYQIPINEDTLKTTQIPLGIIVQPFDESEVERKIVVPVTESEIIRCNRCKAYMNPYSRFIDAGHRFQCSLCHHISEVNQTYYYNLDHTGQRLDKFYRPELYLGSYEFKATAEYCRNGIPNTRRPHIIFACELTSTSKPILQILASQLPEIIKNHLPTDPSMPGSPPPLIGFLTYNSKIQLYDIVNNGHAQVICDVASTFPPLTTFLADPIQHFEQIESFFQSLPTLYSDDELETQTILGPVIEAALQTCQVDKGNWLFDESQVEKNGSFQSQTNNSQTSIPVGKMYIFHCTLPTYGNEAETPGRLKPRWTTSPDEIRKLLGTEKEKLILSPDGNKYYTTLGQRCVTDFASGIELFLFPPYNGPYLDIATLGELAKLTGTGAIYKYFNDFSDRFIKDLKYSLKSTFAFDAIMKVRTSTGIRPVEYFGNFYARTTSDIEFAAINTGSNVGVEIKYDDKLPEDEFVVIQVAILYTSISGYRKVRIHNMAFSPCQQIADVYRNACCDSTINLLARQVITTLRLGEKTVQQSKEILISRVISILTSYRKHCAQPGSSLGQLILPEALKLLPMYLCGMLKCDAIDGGPEMTPDDKAFCQIKIIGAPLSLTHVNFYPRLIRIEYEEQDDNCSSLNMTQIRCSVHRLNTESLAYLLENGFYIMLFIPNAHSSLQRKFLNAIFGPNVDSIQKIQPELGLPKLLTPESQALNNFLENIENERKTGMRLYIIRQQIDKLESIFRGFLYEDKKPLVNAIGGDNSKFEGPSYVDLLCHLHKEIRAQIN